MIDKIIKTYENNYYVLDEVEYKNKKYIFAKSLNTEDTYYVFELKSENSLVIDNIDDVELESFIHNLFLKRLQDF